jgi:hypothetical protein
MKSELLRRLTFRSRSLQFGGGIKYQDSNGLFCRSISRSLSVVPLCVTGRDLQRKPSFRLFRRTIERLAYAALIVGKPEFALHPFNNGRYRSVGLLSISLAKLYALDGPICIKT